MIVAQRASAWQKFRVRQKTTHMTGYRFSNDGSYFSVVFCYQLFNGRQVVVCAGKRIIGYAGAALAPEWFTIAPVEAIKLVLKKTGLSTGDIDLFEINEAFSAVSLAINRELGLDPKRVNVNGGAVALGHPIGATGARILTTLLYALETKGARRGLASLCIGGGEAIAMVVERM